MAKRIIKEVREQKIAERRAFDTAMNARFGKIHLISASALHDVAGIIHFNVRRFAHWVNKRNKKLSLACESVLKSLFGSLGGLSTTRHFA